MHNRQDLDAVFLNPVVHAVRKSRQSAFADVFPHDRIHFWSLLDPVKNAIDLRQKIVSQSFGPDIVPIAG
jgi:hypothetical protein